MKKFFFTSAVASSLIFVSACTNTGSNNSKVNVVATSSSSGIVEENYKSSTAAQKIKFYEDEFFSFAYPSDVKNGSSNLVPLEVSKTANDNIRLDYQTPVGTAGWEFVKVNNITADNLESWAKKEFGQTCIIKGQSARTQKNVVSIQVTEDGPLPEAKCEARHQRILVLLNSETEHLLWAKLGQEPSFYKQKTPEYYDQEIIDSIIIK